MRAPQATKYTDNCGRNSIGLVTIFPWILVEHAIARASRANLCVRERERSERKGEEAMENRTWRLLYTASFYVHRKNAKQACTLAHTSRVRVHTGKTYGGCNRGGSARGVRLPLSTPLRYQPWLDIINGNAIFSSAVQFRVPLSRIRSSILHADLSIPPPPVPPPLAHARISFPFSFSLFV